MKKHTRCDLGKRDLLETLEMKEGRKRAECQLRGLCDFIWVTVVATDIGEIWKIVVVYAGTIGIPGRGACPSLVFRDDAIGHGSATKYSADSRSLPAVLSASNFESYFHH